MKHESGQILPDGSDRQFSRTVWKGKEAVMISPAPGDFGIKEAHAFFHIGSHLLTRKIPVPIIFYFDKDSATLIVEDLGDELLFHRILHLKKQGHYAEIQSIYMKVMELLIFMQISGGEGFDTAWCFQEPVYDHALALEKEVRYFLNAFVKNFVGMEILPQIFSELKWLAKRVGCFCCNRFFLHRDFQSRNLMIRADGQLAIVDFQAGRLGPLGYDLASLLNDPYVDLPFDMRLNLLLGYIQLLKNHNMEIDAKDLVNQWSVLSALRLMQALGAYGFLTKEKGKTFFASFMRPALKGLIWILETNLKKKLPGTISMCKAIFDGLKVSFPRR